VNDPWRCRRCLNEGPRLAAAPVPGPDGRDALARVCAACWREWEQREVMVINELRLNFMDPQAQAVLSKHLREFLLLDDGAEVSAP
jgi:Fe-S cluster biosynthesis and repair protein YggX